MSALFNQLKEHHSTLKLKKSSEEHSKLGRLPLFTSNSRFLDWSLCQNCFDLSEESKFAKVLQESHASFHSKVETAMKQLAEKESEEVDDPLASISEVSFEMETKHQINVDLERTEFFVANLKEKESKEFCFKILFAWSMKNKKLGYRQGMNEVISILMKVVFDFDPKQGKTKDKEESKIKEDVLEKEISKNIHK